MSFKLIVDGMEFFFSDKSMTYLVLMEFLKEIKPKSEINGNNYSKLKTFVLSSMDKMIMESKLKLSRSRFSRSKKVEYKGSEYNLNLSENNHLHFYNLWLLQNALNDSNEQQVLVKWG